MKIELSSFVEEWLSNIVLSFVEEGEFLHLPSICTVGYLTYISRKQCNRFLYNFPLCIFNIEIAFASFS